MKTIVVSFLCVLVSFSLHAQISVVEQNLTAGSWYVTVKNETGKFRRSTGTYIFKVFNVVQGSLTAPARRFAITGTPSGGNGRWNITYRSDSLNRTVYILNLSYNDAIYSPGPPNVYLEFKINNPFTPRRMNLELIPPPKNSNQIIMKKN